MAEATANKIDEAKAEVLAEKAYAAAAGNAPVAKKIAKPAPAKKAAAGPCRCQPCSACLPVLLPPFPRLR